MENPIRLLVADDSLTIQKVIRLALASEPYEIITVSNGAECLEQLHAIKPTVLLIDVSLPGKSAFDIKRELAAEPGLSNTHCVLMSSAFKPVDEDQVLELGFTHRLIKPFDPGDLRRMLEELTAPVQETSPPPSAHRTGVDFDFDTVRSSQNDVQKLTEMTFDAPSQQSVGGEEWTIQESGSQSAFAELPPLTPLEPIGEPTPAEPQGASVETDSLWNDSFSNPPSQSAVDMQDFSPPPALEIDSRPVSNETGGMHFTPAQLELLIQEQVGDQIRRQVEIELQRMTAQLLPNLAEKMIREEIHKMLMNPPASS